MYYSNEMISYLQTNKILALKLEHALTGAGKAVLNQIETMAQVQRERCITYPALLMNIRTSANNKISRISDSLKAFTIF